MIQQGDRVFFSVNSAGPSSYGGPGFRTIQALGLVPLMYQGAGLDSRRSNLDREIRDDFFASKVVILLLGTGQEWRSVGDNWVIPELHHALPMGIECLLYVTAAVNEAQITELDIPINAISVRDEEHFATILRQDLQQLMTAP